MSNPLISLLVPIYNVERYLKECLESARTQSLTDIEVICINDGSTDGSLEIIKEYCQGDSRFKVIDKPNSGYGASMNMGLRAATGKYIGILESDDRLTPNALQLLFEAAEANDAQVAKANFWLYWSVPEERNELFAMLGPDMTNRVVNPQKEHGIFYLKPSIWSAIYLRAFVEDNCISFLETPGASYQDAGFNFKVWASAERVVFLEDPVLHYRQDNEASSVNSPGKVFCVCDEYQEMDRFLCDHQGKAFLKPIQEKMKFDTYMWNYERLSDPLRADFIVRFSDEFNDDVKNGLVDFDLFEPWKRAELELIMEAPLVFHAGRGADKMGFASKLKRYLSVGGVPLLAVALKRKLLSQ